MPTLAVSGDDLASVLLPRSGLLYSTAAGGVALGLAPGPPVDAVPAAGLVDAAYCASCGN